MARYTKTTVSSGFNSSTTINQNFDDIEDAINDTLSRVGDTPNAMEVELDMNDFHIINNPEPVQDDHLVTLAYADANYGGTLLDEVENVRDETEGLRDDAEAARDSAQAAANSAASSETEAANSATEAAASALDAQTYAEAAEVSELNAQNFATSGFSGALSFDMGRITDDLCFSFDMGFITDPDPVAGSIGASVVGGYQMSDGVTEPAISPGRASLYVDTSDGDLKIKFGDGTIKTISTDT